MSQGQIGYMAAQTLANHLRRRKLEAPVVTVVTQVAVDPKDKAFEHPSKPVGPFYSEAEAQRLMLEEGHAMREDAGRGWRRVVPSPEPREIVELPAIRALVAGGAVVVCSGGGGVPVVRSRGRLSGTDAVIDKDLAAALLARELAAEALLILTDVSCAYLHYGTPEQQALGTLTAAEMRALAAAGHFKAGSMGPKVEACLRFAEAGGEAVIASLTEVEEALAGSAGTHILPDARAKRAAKPAAAKRAAQRPAAKRPAKQQPAAKRPAGKPRRRARRDEGADVIDITTRRRAGGE
jgi:carbamate kinase